MTMRILCSCFCLSWFFRSCEAAYATRYWDCCKPHCSWQGNTFGKVNPLATCSKADKEQHDANLVSACVSPAQNSAFTCFDNTPWAVNSSVAFGFAAVPASGDVCGKCYKLTFSGGGKYGANPGAARLRNKVMIVQASNIGYDVHNEQFDVMIPGGGVGAFDACSYQWGVSKSDLGAQYGGFLTACQNQYGHNAPLATYKSCVSERCDAIFGNGKFPQLHAGCKFFVDWYECADNPTLSYTEVTCPSELIRISDMDRGDTITPGPTPGPAPPPGDCPSGNCGCGWANAATCATNDGSKCNEVCCCPFWQPSPTPAPTPPPTPSPTPAPDSTTMVKLNLGNKRCKGKPLKLNGKRWGNLGKGSEKRCKEECIKTSACNYVLYKAANQQCTAFDACDSYMEQAGFTSWKKETTPSPTPAPTPAPTPSPTPAPTPPTPSPTPTPAPPPSPPSPTPTPAPPPSPPSPTPTPAPPPSPPSPTPTPAPPPSPPSPTPTPAPPPSPPSPTPTPAPPPSPPPGGSCDANCQDSLGSQCAQAEKNWNMCSAAKTQDYWMDGCRKTCKSCTPCGGGGGGGGGGPTPGPAPPSGDCPSGNCFCGWATAATCATNDGTTCNKECCCPFRQTPSPTPAPTECKSWCVGHPEDWTKKCTFKACNGCSDCGQRRLDDWTAKSFYV